MSKKIEELKTVIDAIEKLVKQQPTTYIFLRFTLRILKAKVKQERAIVKFKKNNDEAIHHNPASKNP